MTSTKTTETAPPAVSVVIPLYNKARHISRALESVLRQDFTDYEVLVVDDGSTDGGGDVVARCPDPRVRLVTQQNAGESAARNRGVSESRSDLLAFLDADDEWLEGFLSRVHMLSREYPAAGLWGTACWLDRGDGVRVHFPGSQLRNGTGAYTGEIDYFAEPSHPFTPSSILVSRQALVTAGMFPLNVVMGGDKDTFIRIALRYPIVRTRDPFVVQHWDTDNRSNAGRSYFFGLPPYCASVGQYYRTERATPAVPDRVASLLYALNRGHIVTNWLCGDHASGRAIVHWFAGRHGYRVRCLLWRLLFIIPPVAVTQARKVYRVARRRPQPLRLTPCKSLYRV